MADLCTKDALMAPSNTSFTHFPVSALHSTYLAAPIVLANINP